MRRFGVLVVVVGLLLLSLAAGDALADDAGSVDMEDYVSRTCETIYAA